MLRVGTIPRRGNPISLTPLIDVVFILLLFFMLSSNFQNWRQINISVPASSDTIIPQERPEFTVLHVNVNGGAFLIGTQRYHVSKEDELKVIISDAADTIFVIDTAPDVSLQTIVTLVETLKSLGVKDVSLAAQRPAMSKSEGGVQ